MNSPRFQTLTAVAIFLSAAAFVTGCASSNSGAPRPGPKVETYTPITIIKLTPTPPPSAMARSRAPKAKSIPTGTDAQFTFSPDTWPTGVTSTTLKVRCFVSTIQDQSTLASLTYNSAAPLAVFPGTSNTYKSVTVTTTTPGSVTINIPATLGGVSMAGKNFLLIATRDVIVGSDTVKLGGASVFSTAP